MYMETISANHTQVMFPTELRFFAIPTRWTGRDDAASDEQDFVPAVSQHVERRLSRVADPEDIRKQLFRMDIAEEAALDFLNGVGVWDALEDHNLSVNLRGVLLSGGEPVGTRDMLLTG